MFPPPHEFQGLSSVCLAFGEHASQGARQASVYRLAERTRRWGRCQSHLSEPPFWGVQPREQAEVAVTSPSVQV